MRLGTPLQMMFDDEGARDYTTKHNLRADEVIEIEAVMLLKGATSEGRSGVLLGLVDGNGKRYIASTTLRLLWNATHGMRIRSPETFDDYPPFADYSPTPEPTPPKEH